ncbi:MAG: hypothetical protein Q8906_13900 [Bacillota bacterium]|nr:hypothetical protein [Bacillota bacterium]
MAKNYALYYGYGEAEMLSRFDLAVIEPKGMKLEEIDYLKERKTLVLSYLSLMEVHPHEPIFKNLTEDDFLIVDYEPAMNAAYGTYLVNLRSKKWITHLMSEVKYRLQFLGTDGIFMDTIGDLELPYLPPAVKKEQMEAYVNILYIFKTMYPNHLFLQNNGLESIVLESAPWIDGILWENPPLTLKSSEEWVNVIITRLDELQHQFNLRIFLLFEESVEKERKSFPIAKKIAGEKNYLLYSAPNHYVDGISLP